MKGINKFNTSKVIDMFAIFSFCSDQQYLNLSDFETNNATNMFILFLKCRLFNFLLDKFK